MADRKRRWDRASGYGTAARPTRRRHAVLGGVVSRGYEDAAVKEVAGRSQERHGPSRLQLFEAAAGAA